MIVLPHVVRCGVVMALAGLLAGCGGGGSPVTPTPPPGPGPAPTPNSAPVIESLTASAERVETGEEVTLTATVRDAETPVSQLRYEWTAAGGTFMADQPGTARWRAPSDRPTPDDYRVTLTVIETYGPGNAQEHRVTASSPVIRVHNSVAELSDLATLFLTEFSNSSIPAETTVRNFSDSCNGKQAELEDVRANRRNFRIDSYQLGQPAVTVQFGGICPFRGRHADACIATSVVWVSTPTSGGPPETTRGTSRITAVYETSRWWLCDSEFEGVSTSSATFMR